MLASITARGLSFPDGSVLICDSPGARDNIKRVKYSTDARCSPCAVQVAFFLRLQEFIKVAFSGSGMKYSVVRGQRCRNPMSLSHLSSDLAGKSPVRWLPRTKIRNESSSLRLPSLCTWSRTFFWRVEQPVVCSCAGSFGRLSSRLRRVRAASFRVSFVSGCRCRVSRILHVAGGR